MADDNDVYPLTGNDDLITAGLLPEDDDDIRDDAAVLLGINVSSGFAPIDLDVGDGGGGLEPAPSVMATGTPVSSNSTDGTSCLGKRKSGVWVDGQISMKITMCAEFTSCDNYIYRLEHPLITRKAQMLRKEDE